MKLSTSSLPADQKTIVFEVQSDAEIFARPIVTYFEVQARAGRRFYDGETVDLGWSLLLLQQTDDDLLEAFEPDFDCMPIRWCRGINNTLRHLHLQRAVCDLFGSDPVFPTIRQAGIISFKFLESSEYTMCRDTPADSDSGWVFSECGYAGPEGEFCSLYQVSLRKPEIVPFLALPASTRVTISPGFCEVTVGLMVRSSADDDLLRALAISNVRI